MAALLTFASAAAAQFGGGQKSAQSPQLETDPVVNGSGQKAASHLSADEQRL
jgi:hypothetical protein